MAKIGRTGSGNRGKDEYQRRVSQMRNRKEAEANQAEEAGLSSTAQRYAQERSEAANKQLDDSKRPWFRRWF